MAPSALRVLRFPNVRLFFGGQIVSLVGTWMTRLATAWLIYRLTKSAFLLGVVSFAGQIPTFLLSPLAGVWVDRWNRQRVMVVTQTLFAILALALAGFTLSGHITLGEVIAISAIGGVVNAVDLPARQTFLMDIVEDRGNAGAAIGLNSSVVNLARLAGPSLAGLTIAAVGEGYCFLIDGISYFAVIASLLMMRVPRADRVLVETPLVEQLREGWAYASGFKPIRMLLLMFGIVSFIGVPYTVLMPVFASKMLGGGAGTLGLLMGANGVGALLSAARLAVRETVVGLYRVIAVCTALFGCALIAFATSRTLAVSLILMVIVGYGLMQSFTGITTVIQTIVPADKRGRVMSYWTMAYMGAAPFGSVAAGAMATAIGSSWTLAICGAGALLGAVWFWSRRHTVRGLVRPIYEQLGILPAHAEPPPPS